MSGLDDAFDALSKIPMCGERFHVEGELRYRTCVLTPSEHHNGRHAGPLEGLNTEDGHLEAHLLLKRLIKRAGGES